MKSLILVAHGSRREASNQEVRVLTDKLREQAEGNYDMVCCGFLELAQPSIPDAIESCVQQGATEVIVLPYFLSAGRHVVTDIPAEVATKQHAYPHINIHIAPYLGASTQIPSTLLGLLESE